MPVTQFASADRVGHAPSRVRAALFAALHDGPQVVSLFDPSDRLVYGNAAYREAWAVEDSEFPSFASIMRSCHAAGKGALIETDDIEQWVGTAEVRRRTGTGFRAFEVDLCDGRWFWMTERRLDDGWLLSIGQDITALKHNEQTVKAARDAAIRLSLTDPLTQLFNRRWAMEQLEARISSREDFYLALIDIDHFKRFNDDYGHAVGDAVLVAVANHLKRLEISKCSVARLAGDEFAVIAPSNRDQRWFEAILKSFAWTVSQPFDVQGHAITIELSIGAAHSRALAKDPGALLACADTAMYHAKRSGRSAISFEPFNR